MKKVKKRKFKKPNVGMKAQGKISNISYSGVRVHSGGVYDQLRHTILTYTLIPPQTKELMAAQLKTIITGPEAATLPDGQNGWSVIEFTNPIIEPKRVFLLRYKGQEAALFFKRQLTEVKLQAGDKYPDGVLQDPAEAWQRLDLLGRSAKQSNVILTHTHSRLEEENTLLTSRIKTLEELNSNLESKLSKTEDTINYLTIREKVALIKRRRKDDKLQEKKHARELVIKRKRFEEKSKKRRKKH